MLFLVCLFLTSGSRSEVARGHFISKRNISSLWENDFLFFCTHPPKKWEDLERCWWFRRPLWPPNLELACVSEFNASPLPIFRTIVLLKSNVVYKAVIISLILVVVSLSLLVTYAYATKGPSLQTSLTTTKSHNSAARNSGNHQDNSKHNSGNSAGKHDASKKQSSKSGNKK